MNLNPMKRDVLLALSVGFFVGALSAITAVKLPSLLPNTKQPSSIEIESTITPEVTLNKGIIEITDPKDDSIITKNTVEIKGRALSNSLILIETDLESLSTEASSDGSFKFTAKLSEGGNPIYITSVNEQSEETKNMTLFYTADKL